MNITKSELAKILEINEDELSLNNGLWDVEIKNNNPSNIKAYLIIPDKLIKNGELIVSFGAININFFANNINLISLKGCPHTIKGDFYCCNNKLTSLKFGPKNVDGSYYCSNNELSSLKYSPKFVGGNFYCYYNKITSLDYAPSKVGLYHNFVCSYNKIERLDFLIGCKKLEVHNNKITYISDDIDLSDVSLYKNPYHYFKKSNYGNN